MGLRRTLFRNRSVKRRGSLIFKKLPLSRIAEVLKCSRQEEQLKEDLNRQRSIAVKNPYNNI